ncbi:hypothetical protein L195_g041466 [Trifolium pratense]|uniref:Uncharacterized protein n=1 Tax=Trifolium pratense TaxID=57577 RepID=A0A2K3M3M0_TRIPR|nr:hypothetical protein L195_g041466 [Trifolium pratense]
MLWQPLILKRVKCNIDGCAKGCPCPTVDEPNPCCIKQMLWQPLKCNIDGCAKGCPCPTVIH